MDLALFRYCAAGCLTCPHEGRRGEPSRQATFDAYGKTRRAFSGPDALGLNHLLPEQIQAWLDETPSSRRPAYVTLGLHAEPLPGFEVSTAVALESLRPLLRAGVGLSLRTRRNIPDDLLALLAEHRDRVWVTVPLPMLDPKSLRAWEPGTGSPSQRLYTAQRLLAAGISTAILAHPIIPFVNDGARQLEALANAVADVGVKLLGASYLRLRPTIRRRLDDHSPVSVRLLYGAYLRRHPDGDRARLLPPRDSRLAAYKTLAAAARPRGLTLRVCRCLDPELGRGPCVLWPGDPTPRTHAAQEPGSSPRKLPPRPRRGQVGIDEWLENEGPAPRSKTT